MTGKRLTFLGDNPTHAQLERAIAANSRQWIMRRARAASGEVHHSDGATWVYTPAPGGETSVAFPRLRAATAGAVLDRIMAFYRSRQPYKSMLAWSLLPAQPRDLGARLVARGFDWCWQPRWMWLDFNKRVADHPHPPGLRVESVEGEPLGDVQDLPYYDVELDSFYTALPRVRSRRVWHFAAWLDGRIVGHSVVHLTTGSLGVAGIFDVGVVPAARNQGIGKALVAAACQQAQSLGCRHALLNGTGEPMYRQIGFERIGFGQTWFLREDVLQAPPPTERQVLFAEAVGRADLKALEALFGEMKPEALDNPLPAGMTLIDLALNMERPAAAEWLVQHGATLDVLSAWALGGAERVRQLLESAPERANARLGQGKVAPLHVATEDGNTELVRALLEASPDLECQSFPGGNPLHVAAWHGHTEIMRLLLAHHPPVNATNQYGSTPLMTAIRAASRGGGSGADQLGIIRSLIAAGATVNGVDGGGKPLCLAAEGKQIEIARILLEHGADPDRKSPEGKTPLSIALANGDEAMVRLLCEHGAKE